ncbi:2-oxoacid:ferredoxin oxidoreductase subunit beta [Aneurinibacillus aneurinilyticus]|jgi:2-oxoglutarate ferredoxin oxidoreductase subunit beta|uniref:2-oxoacid:ferredoxin oxidoreductase subunit beta n=2 Tax=Aneurinibacillus aneurinilyticus TaxID=1391 RepID=A0A848CP41_ANEAE|nr:2-oxoacid:ferredoxin oxidoreductase subunit beta [Aneurinibacillus aneurinilyticus]ERI08281.1 2-oxoacid:acceptor oxidoreductase, beta subunit, pyruvate/2-ketoisovalerate family [Aneurinibacillus aneurinilyticus ATCC 12856]MCI1692894.1 2-oxoacid:ferredoxin oxidoreductase subunit beta [Aneurinibacillus aneurinilyticus]MED0669788.1 2-oxoacid:ferredoxin oxidoreductase subunit beta [Aneurinibacillus aneurinilyticus]MED0705697.1 2-oxoacid:ferredoxin oxidoreductase subunit beta [Aneurinibacillus an
MATFKDFRNSVKPNWCPGCGDFSVQAAIQRAAASVGLEPENLAVVSGIGCSGRISGYINAYGVHGIHGRSLPIAQGLKMANRELTVIASGGDGDGFAIGMSHTIHAIRRNMDITYIVMDNQIYGLTKGQTSPRSAEGFVTKSTPKGSIEPSMKPLELALAAGATFVAQTMSSDLKGMTSLIEQGLKHKGFSLINVFSPCVTFNKVNTYDWFKEHVKNLSDVEGYDAHDRIAAMRVLMETDGLVNGLIYQNKDRDSYESMVAGFKEEGLVKQDLTIEEAKFQQLMAEFM